MRKGYKYFNAVLASISDCEEIALSVYQEKVYNFGLKRIIDSPTNWKERTNTYEESLRKTARHKWVEILIMD